jgi:hypothetical protein
MSTVDLAGAATLLPQLRRYVGQRRIAEYVGAADHFRIVIHQVGEPRAGQDLDGDNLLHALFKFAEAERLACLDIHHPHAAGSIVDVLEPFDQRNSAEHGRFANLR